MKKELKLYPKYVSMAFKSTLSFKADSIVQIISFSFVNIISFLSLMLMLSNVPTLGGWSFERIVFLFGFCLIPKAIDHIFFDNIWLIGWRFVRSGEIDLYLTKPLNPLFQIIAREFKWDGLGDLVMGIILICVYGPLTNAAFTFLNTVLLIVCCLAGVAVFSSIKLITASVAFWTKQSGPLMTIVHGFSDYVKYPLDALSKVLKYILFFVIPYGLFLFYPVQTFLSGGSMLYPLIISISLGAFLLLFSYKLWQAGLKRYEGAGN